MKKTIAVGFLFLGLLFPRSLHSQGASTLSFTRHDLTIGDHPISLASADFNGDGFPDLAVLSAGTTVITMSIYLGDGTGGFALKTSFNTSSTWVIAADLNKDNKPDLVTADSYRRSVSVFLGKGDGTFADPSTIALPGRIESVIAADFNGDGKLDLAAPDFEPQPYAVSILLGNGDGTFGPNTEYPTLDVPFVVIADDFNADGKRDLAINSQFGGVSVLLGNGDGTFQPKKDLSTGSTASATSRQGISTVTANWTW